MAIPTYYMGAIPSRPIAIDVHDSGGLPINLSAYTDFKVILLGSDNEVIDTTGAVLSSSGAAQGRFVLRWPVDRSLFNKAGDYLLQMEIDGVGGTKDYTTEQTIRVRRLGGIK